MFYLINFFRKPEGEEVKVEKMDDSVGGGDAAAAADADVEKGYTLNWFCIVCLG